MIDLSPFSLKGKNIVVTGASSGIGKSIAKIFDSAGAHLILSGRNESALASILGELKRRDHQIVIGDLTQEDTLNKFIELDLLFDGIVHSAGIMKLLPFKYVKKEPLQEIMDINFFAPIELTSLLYRNRKLKRGASIVFITSVAGTIVGQKANTMYSATKGALTGMIRAMAIDLAKSHIRVNNIAPGMISTKGALDELQDKVTINDIEEDKKKYLFNRYGEPEEVAYACQYLISDASRFITGSILVVDGGFTIV